MFTPYWFGRQAEQAYRQQLHQLQLAGGARIVDDHYQRGWFSSTAGFEFALTRVPLRIVAHHRVYPGPLPADDPLDHLRSFQPLQAVIKTEGKLQMGGVDHGRALPFSARTLIHLDGTAATHLDIPAGRISVGDGLAISWQTAHGRLRWLAQELHGTLTSEGIEAQIDGAWFTLGLTSANFATYPGSSGLELGQNAINVASLEANAARIPPVVIQDLYLESQAAEADATAGYAILAKFSDASYGEERFGPGKLALEIERLDARTLVEIRRGSKEALTPARALTVLLHAIAKHRATASGRMEITEPSGKTSMDLRIDIARRPTAANLRALLRVINATIELEAPRTMISRFAHASVASELEKLAAKGNIPALDDTQTQRIMNTAISKRIQSWADQGLVVGDANADLYLLHASYRGGDLRVNGNRIDLLSVGR